MAWVWDEFAQYRLTEEVLEKFLTDTFGNYNFYIQVFNPTALE